MRCARFGWDQSGDNVISECCTVLSTLILREKLHKTPPIVLLVFKQWLLLRFPASDNSLNECTAITKKNFFYSMSLADLKWRGNSHQSLGSNWFAYEKLVCKMFLHVSKKPNILYGYFKIVTNNQQKRRWLLHMVTGHSYIIWNLSTQNFVFSTYIRTS